MYEESTVCVRIGRKLGRKGMKTAPNNYRPISLASILGKLMESIIADNIVTSQSEIYDRVIDDYERKWLAFCFYQRLC
jgi:hypothetical protein